MNQLRTEHDDWVELFALSDYVPPKFWLGDRVKVHDREATVMGVEWKPQGEKPFQDTARAGWWYCLRWQDSGSILRLFEAMLVRADETD